MSEHVRGALTDTLAALRRASIARQIEWADGTREPLPILFKATELGGEAGEVLNVVKKLERERLGWTGSRATVEQLADELADLIICADLLAEPYGIDLGAAIIRKFNATSEQRGLTTRLATLANHAEAAVDYTNLRGERSTRVVIPTGRLLPGDATYHPTARWVIEAWDVAKGAMRTLDPAHIHAWGDQRPRSSAAVFRASLAETKAALADATFDLAPTRHGEAEAAVGVEAAVGQPVRYHFTDEDRGQDAQGREASSHG